MTAITSTQLLEHLDGNADMHRESAARALRDLIGDAEQALTRLQDHDSVSQSIGGSILNQQRWQDAERSLVRFWDAKDAAALAARVPGAYIDAPDDAAHHNH